MENWLVIISMFFPVVCGFIVLIFKNTYIRNSIITLASVVLIANSIGFTLFFGERTVTLHGFPGLELNEIIAALDIALLIYIISIGLGLRSWLITILALCQLIPLVYFELVYSAELIHSGPIFRLDGLSIVMTLIISIIGSLIAVFSIGYMKNHEEHLKLEKSRQPRFFFIIFLFLGAMNGLVLTDNLIWMFFFWEITTLSSFLLISHDRTEESLNNAKRALWINLLGGVGFLIGIIFIFTKTGTVIISSLLQQDVLPKEIVLLPIAFLSFAALTKSAQLPFQSWLLGAMVAPTPVSALLHSSTMVKAGVYLIVRFSPAFADTMLGFVIALTGAFTFMAASAIAISQSNAKRILAYSTIANLGLIIACAGIGTPAAIGAAILLIIFHAISKGLLFLCVGTIEQEIHSRDIEDMEGLVRRMPFTATVAAIGAASMLLPPFGVLVSKWLAIEAAVKMPVVLVLIVIGSAFTLVFWTKFIGKLLSTQQGKEARMEKLAPSVFSTLSILVTGAIAASVSIVPLFNFFVSPQFTGMTGVRIAGAGGQLGVIDEGVIGSFAYLPVFIVLAAIALSIPFILRRVSPERVRQPYFCGENCEIEGNIGFKGEADRETAATFQNYYLKGAFSEETLSKWLSVAGGILIVVLFLTAIIIY